MDTVNQTGTSADTGMFFKDSKGRNGSYRVNAEGVGATEHPRNGRVQLQQRSGL